MGIPLPLAAPLPVTTAPFPVATAPLPFTAPLPLAAPLLGVGSGTPSSSSESLPDSE